MQDFREVKENIGNENYRRLYRSFLSLTKNPNLKIYNEDEGYKYYITRDSFFKHFRTLFGHDNKPLRDSLWQLLSEGSSTARVSFLDFIEKMSPFFFGKEDHISKFIFGIYDLDKDNFIDGLDIVTWLKELPPSSQLCQEFKILQGHFVET